MEFLSVKLKTFFGSGMLDKFPKNPQMTFNGW